MKKIFSILLIVLPIFAQDSLHYQAHQWARDVINISNEQELQALLNLLYWSYQRSVSTLQAQQAFLADQHIATQAIYSITSTRLNPSRQHLYTIDPDQLHILRQHFIHAQQEHYRIGKTYSECIDTVLKTSLLSSQVQKMALELRHQARMLVAHQLYDHLMEIDKHLATVQDAVKESHQLFQKMHSTRAVGDLFFNYLWDIVPMLAAKSFVQFDKQLTDINHQLWHTLLKSEEFGNYRWRIIEEKRAEFYATYYNALYQHAQQVTILSPAAFILLFDEPSKVLPVSLSLRV